MDNIGPPDMGLENVEIDWPLWIQDRNWTLDTEGTEDGFVKIGKKGQGTETQSVETDSDAWHWTIVNRLWILYTLDIYIGQEYFVYAGLGPIGRRRVSAGHYTNTILTLGQIMVMEK
jgi:hypothetical protein